MSERITCEKHPRYTAQRKPRSKCRICWAIYLVENYFAMKTTAEDVKAVGDMLDAFNVKEPENESE